MPNNNDERLIARLSGFLSENMGLYFPEKHREELKRKMSAAMKDFGFERFDTFTHWLLSAPLTRHQIEILARHLTVRETYFFRETKAFDVLEQRILPELISSRRQKEKRIRIWSAGCSTGEEAYSMAILLGRLVPDIKDWNITILATDINPHVLKNAEKGVYSEWSFRETQPRIKELYFKKLDNGKYEIHPDIKEMVVFNYLNLSEDTYPSLSNNTNAMDLILCRNVLMYFAPGYAESTVRRFHRSLIEGGSLIVSVVEVSSLFASEFHPVRFKDMTFYKKDSNFVRSGKVVPLLNNGNARPSIPCKRSKPSKRRERPSLKSTNAAETVKHTSTPYEEASARVLANQGRLTDALRWCEKAIEADKLNPGLYYLLATIQLEQGMTDEAIAGLNKALYLDPDYILAYFTLGSVMHSLGRKDESGRYFRNTAEILLRYKPEEILPESDGMTAGRLAELLRSVNS